MCAGVLCVFGCILGGCGPVLVVACGLLALSSRNSTEALFSFDYIKWNQDSEFRKDVCVILLEFDYLPIYRFVSLLIINGIDISSISV